MLMLLRVTLYQNVLANKMDNKKTFQQPLLLAESALHVSLVYLGIKSIFYIFYFLKIIKISHPLSNTIVSRNKLNIW